MIDSFFVFKKSSNAQEFIYNFNYLHTLRRVSKNSSNVSASTPESISQGAAFCVRTHNRDVAFIAFG